MRDELSGGWLVEPAELFRLYAEHDAVRGAANGEVRNDLLIKRFPPLKPFDASADAAIRDLVAERERERAQLLDQIADLRRRLDAESEERRRLTAVLADQRVNPSPDVRGSKPPSTTEGSSPAPARRRRWWRFGR